jgi:hypothetical protein
MDLKERRLDLLSSEQEPVQAVARAVASLIKEGISSVLDRLSSSHPRLFSVDPVTYFSFLQTDTSRQCNKY